jgi:Icc-related predicted phosphoesterase
MEPAAVRIAAVGDLHFGMESQPITADDLTNLADDADMLLVAGDLTQLGDPREAQRFADVATQVGVPVITVLGNHDHHADRELEIESVLRDAGISVLEGSSTTIDVHGTRVGVAGVKGFGGGFPGASGAEFGERIMRDFIAHTRHTASELERALADLEADVRIALLHYSPVEATLNGEREAIHPFLGSYHLAEAIDCGQAHLALHGHAHHGAPWGETPGGIPVRNVAHSLLDREPYALMTIEVGVDGVRLRDLHAHVHHG